VAAAPQSTPAPQIAKANAPILPGRRYAVYDALGIRVRSMPLTAEQLIAAMPD